MTIGIVVVGKNRSDNMLLGGYKRHIYSFFCCSYIFFVSALLGIFKMHRIILLLHHLCENNFVPSAAEWWFSSRRMDPIRSQSIVS